MSFQRHRFTPSDIERLLHYMPTVAANAENEWAGGFAKSVLVQSRRRNWKPSEKQLSVMQGLVNDLFTHGGNVGGDLEVIED